jgi:hypothetical protein
VCAKAGLLVIVLTLTACSDQNAARHSALTSTRSLAAETELFLEFVLGGHSNEQYAEAHTEYLEKAIADLLEDVRRENLPSCEAALSALAQELPAVRNSVAAGDLAALTRSRDAVRKLRQNLRAAG